MKTSAMDKHQKMRTLSQECFRRLHNTSENISEDVKLGILNEFMLDLKTSGYGEKERLNILNAGIQTFKNLKEKVASGLRPMYRDCEFKERMKASQTKSQKNSSWFKRSSKSPYVSVMFVEATPDDKLIRMIRRTEDKHRISDHQRIKFVSKSGVKLVNLLQRKDPFEENCKDGCAPCEDATKRHRLSHCHRTGVHYEAKCVDCDNRGKMRKYHGETARNVHVRSKEHLSDLKNKREKSWMLKHIKKNMKMRIPKT